MQEEKLLASFSFWFHHFVKSSCCGFHSDSVDEKYHFIPGIHVMVNLYSKPIISFTADGEGELGRLTSQLQSLTSPGDSRLSCSY